MSAERLFKGNTNIYEKVWLCGKIDVFFGIGGWLEIW